MTAAAAPDPAHFTRAVTQLGERQRVVSSTAVFNAQGLKVIDKGVVIDARLYERLTQHQLRQPLDQCVEAESTVHAAALREAVQTILDTEPFFGAMIGTGRLRDQLLEEVSQVPLPKPVAFQLTIARETQPELWRHGLHCAITAAWLADRQHATRHDLRMLATAGLLHDLGMLHVDPVLMQPTIQLERAQRRQLYAHPLVSTMLLERHHEFPRPVLSAVLEHHERLDGSGYPRGVRDSSISPWGRILALAELVTAMIDADHPTPMTRLSVALRMNGHRFERPLVAEVLALLERLPHEEAMPPADGAIEDLIEIDRLLRAWPATHADAAADARAVAVSRVHDQCGQVLRLLADAGAASAQLEMLGGDVDPALASELALILHEASWQLRIVSRQARRRWALGKDEAFPDWMAGWLGEIDQVCDRRLGTVDARPEPVGSVTDKALAG